MTIDDRCAICKSADRRKLVELGWNDGMSCPDISNGLGGSVNPETILRHLKKHTDGGAIRNVPVPPSLPMRDRVYAIQKMQVDEVERRVQMAQERAAEWNREMANVEGFEPRDWSYYFDILHKDAQAAIASILKTQGLADKREKAQGDLKLGLFEAMANAGLAPKSLIGGREVPALPSGEVPDGD